MSLLDFVCVIVVISTIKFEVSSCWRAERMMTLIIRIAGVKGTALDVYCRIRGLWSLDISVGLSHIPIKR